MNALYRLAAPIVPSAAAAIIGLSVAAMTAGCAHDLSLMKKDETLNAYRSAIRWSAFEQTAAFRNSPITDRRTSANLKDIHVTGYEVLTQREDKTQQILQQTVAIRYYRAADLTEKTTVDEQDWRYDPERDKWFLHSALPRFD